MTPAQDEALQMLRANRERVIYETGKPPHFKMGSGEFLVTYSNGHGPKLSKADIAALVNAGLIVQWNDCPGFYGLAE